MPEGMFRFLFRKKEMIEKKSKLTVTLPRRELEDDILGKSLDGDERYYTWCLPVWRSWKNWKFSNGSGNEIGDDLPIIASFSFHTESFHPLSLRVL